MKNENLLLYSQYSKLTQIYTAECRRLEISDLSSCRKLSRSFGIHSTTYFLEVASDVSDSGNYQQQTACTIIYSGS